MLRKKTLRIMLYLILLIVFGDVIPYNLIPAPDPVPNGGHISERIYEDVRPTGYQPQHYNHRIILFGNSSLNAYYLDTEDTIASYLQEKLSDDLVINMAIPADNISAQYLKLKQFLLRSSDMVIFYDGAVEAISANADRAFYCSVPIGILALVCAHTPNILDSSKRDNLVVDAKRALDLSRTWTSQHGIAFLHVIQPICVRPNNPFDTSKAQMMKAVVDSDPAAIDLSRMLDCYNDYFFDFIHTRPLANKLIADALYAMLVEQF